MSPDPKAKPRRRRRPSGERFFFPAAALYAALAVPLSVHGMLTGSPWLPGLATVLDHAHELLFGFALAVVAGFLINQASWRQLWLLLGVWLLARIASVGWPDSLAVPIMNSAFALLLVWQVAPPFLKSAKKLRNQAFAPLLVALGAAVLAFHLARVLDLVWLEFTVLQTTVLLLATLMLFMGGRIIAPIAAGVIERQGGELEARIQPRIEAALLVLMALAVGLSLIQVLPWAEGMVLAITGALAMLRLWRWRLWQCRARPDLWCLGLGYGWLGVGLLLLASASLTDWMTASTATHAITVGALGTLSIGVMTRVRLTRNKLDPAKGVALPVMTACIALAALLRLFAPAAPLPLAVGAGLWSLAMLGLLLVLMRPSAR